MTSSRSRVSPSKNGQKTKPSTPKFADVDILSSSVFARFKQQAKRDVLFHTLFLGLAMGGLILCAFFFSFLADSFLLGIFIACFFFTLVLYFVLKLYFQEQKIGLYTHLRDECLAPFQSMPELVIEQAEAIAKKLEGSDMTLFALPKSLDAIKPSFEKLCKMLLWTDVQLFSELFLKKCLDIRLQRIKEMPSDPLSHAELATSYMALANHNRRSKNLPADAKRLQSFFQSYTKLAIVELEIVEELTEAAGSFQNTPQRLWLHSKLAENYQLLGQKGKAIQEYERVLELNPDDPDALYTLGNLYFTEGKNGKGLKIHEKLSLLDPLKAKSLIASYGSV